MIKQTTLFSSSTGLFPVLQMQQDKKHSVELRFGEYHPNKGGKMLIVV